ncbi:L-lactate dehydrogenase [Suttonella ornithocola]|uniref:L-lactate dehydrogenase n=1 Tax=Suttonella ornithocola TaxID=279832 RepID=A0A380MM02_9GAMM|nr:L-lactate dehydrogenase [Suttonella ornithocola]SUO93342.1 L-lactate dehydrogenase [Suttonella ornithocola]
MAKVSVIGTGFVGASSAYAMALTGACSDLMLVDLNEERARAEAADISHGAAVSSGVRVHSGHYPDITGSAAVVIAAGVNQKPGESRLNLLSRNASIFQSVVPEVVKYAPDAVVIIATNPVDIMTEVTRILHPKPELVLGTGTVLDTARFRDLLGRESGVSPRYIHANVLGEHGDSSVLCWDHAQVAGMPIREFLASMDKQWTQELADLIESKVRGAAGTIIAGKQATYYGIGAAVAKIVEAVLKDSRAVMTVSGPSEYGVCLALPRVIGKSGIMHTLDPLLSDCERKGLEESAAVLLETQSPIIKDGKLLLN